MNALDLVSNRYLNEKVGRVSVGIRGTCPQISHLGEGRVNDTVYMGQDDESWSR